jgi:hypothetical protein
MSPNVWITPSATSPSLQRRRGIRIEPAVPQYTLAVALDQFLNDLASEGKAPKTLTTYGEGLRLFFSALVGGRTSARTSEITERAIRDWLGSPRRNRASASTVTNRYGAIRAFCRWAVAQNQLADNPTDGIPWPKPGEKEIPVIADTQIAALLRTCAGPRSEDLRDTAGRPRAGRGRPGRLAPRPLASNPSRCSGREAERPDARMTR